MKQNILGILITISTLTAGAQANAFDFGGPVETGKPVLGAGLQSMGSTFGVSAKYRYTDKLVAQATLAAAGEVKIYSVRGLYNFNAKPDYVLYGFAGIGLWSWGGGAGFESENSIGFSGGGGIEYIVPNSTIALSAELGASMVSFDNYSGVSSITLGLGAHYYF